MSDAFSFLFSFYGLILGLSVTELASGFSRAYDSRRVRRLGVLAPLFAIVLLLDLITYWLNAWDHRALTDVTFELAVTAAVVALLYYFASTQIFPQQGETETLDDHILSHRRTVVGCVVASNLMTAVPEQVHGVLQGATPGDVAMGVALNGAYYGLLVAAALLKDRRLIIAALVSAIVLISGAMVILR